MAGRTTTERGLGYQHQQNRRYLIANHVDGTLCWWCNLPMFKEAARNHDHAELEADHSLSRADGGHRADRLLHRICNRQRGRGQRDHLRPAATGTPILALAGQAVDALTDMRLMPWPW